MRPYSSCRGYIYENAVHIKPDYNKPNSLFISTLAGKDDGKMWMNLGGCGDGLFVDNVFCWCWFVYKLINNDIDIGVFVCNDVVVCLNNQ